MRCAPLGAWKAVQSVAFLTQGEAFVRVRRRRSRASTHMPIAWWPERTSRRLGVMRFRFLGLVVACCLLPLTARTSRAQEASVAQQTREAPDASQQCQAAFAHIGAGRFADALAAANAAIASFPRPLNARTRRTLGACYYNRGRAHEGLTHRREAVEDYLRSLRVRPDNEAVAARIRLIVPDVVPTYLPTALAMLDPRTEGGFDAGDVPNFRPEVASVTSADGVVWHFLGARVGAPDSFHNLVVYAFAEHGDEVSYEIVDSFTQEENAGAGSVQGPRAFAASGVIGVTLTTSASGGLQCDGELMDMNHSAFVIVTLQDGAIVSRSFVLEERECDLYTRNRVRLRGANVVLQRAGDGLGAGAHPIAAVLGLHP